MLGKEVIKFGQFTFLLSYLHWWLAECWTCWASWPWWSVPSPLTGSGH